MIGDEPEDSVPGSGDGLFYFKSYQKMRERERKEQYQKRILTKK